MKTVFPSLRTWTAPLLLATVATGALLTLPALAQTRAALVQSIDEPGRNPYQDTQREFCGGAVICTFEFAAVPAGKRLVLTHVTGFAASGSGTLPGAFVNSNQAYPGSGSQFASLAITGVRSSTAGYVIYNQNVLAYFGPGERVFGSINLAQSGATFSGEAQLMLSGYYVNLP